MGPPEQVIKDHFYHHSRDWTRTPKKVLFVAFPEAWHDYKVAYLQGWEDRGKHEGGPIQGD